MEFKPFPKIERIGKIQMHITQKIHGTNAQIFIYPDKRILEKIKPNSMTLEQAQAKYPNLKISFAPANQEETWIVEDFLNLICGSRTRWIYPGDDNYGFAAFVHLHKEEFIKKLGVGQHFGEWAGPGINSGEGLAQRTFVLFDFWKYPPERPAPYSTVVVPVLYQGPMDLQVIDQVMADLKARGSKLVPGFMRPEGVVISMLGTRYKKVFEAEDTKWKNPDEAYQATKQSDIQKALTEYGHLLQPIRLEKVLSKDSKLLENFPQSLPEIVDAYWQDLVDENQIDGLKGELKGIRKMLGSELFKFVRINAGAHIRMELT